MLNGRKVTLVLGGGGIKGLAHIGVLKALRAFGIEPDEYVGTSVGSFIGALAAGGMSVDQIESIALAIRREDILDHHWISILWRRGRARSIYRGKVLHDFVRRTLPVDRFEDLKKPLYLLAVNLTRGEEVIWGMPGLTQVPIHDCVVASCALPGIFPPKKINRYYFVDGSLVDTVPIKIAIYHNAQLIIAVYLESLEAGRFNGTAPAGIADVLMQSQSMLSRTLFKHNLRHFQDAPLVLVQPQVYRQGMFEFADTKALIEEGERAAFQAFSTHPLLADVPAPAAPPPPSDLPDPHERPQEA